MPIIKSIPPTWLRSRPMGFVVFALGVTATVAPIWAGEWTLAILGLVVLAAAVVELVRVARARSAGSAEIRYTEAFVLLLLGLIFFYSPALVLRGVVAVLGGLLLFDGILKIVAVVRRRADAGLWELVNGIAHAVAGALIIHYRFSIGPAIVGLVVGLWLISTGWEMIFRPRDLETGEAPEFAPGARFGLGEDPEFKRLAKVALDLEAHRLPNDIRWCIGLAIVFFAIHIGRMDLRWNVFGAASTLVAVAGDLMWALVIALLIVLPIRLLWRGVTRAAERNAWRRRLGPGASSKAIGDRFARWWLDGRLRLDARLYMMRGSFGSTVARVIQFGLPLTVLLVAINPIWGFSWFFNTENWVSGFWQKLVETRVDPWRVAMIDSVVKLEGAPGPTAPGLFDVTPAGVSDAADFSFLVLGDTGEGDPSQHSLKDQFLLEGRRDDVKFLVVSSDVIYPAGAMKDYEFNFYLPFKGFEKPIFAIPGNHDWFGGDDAFNANFLEPDAARSAMRARLDTDHVLTSSAGRRVDTMIADAARLRDEYRVETGFQRGPFFEVHGQGFSLIAVDTGILKRVDERQLSWFESALERSKGTFTMVILGHPLYAGGYDMGQADPVFGQLHTLLAKYHVPVVMAGDTHDFEYYRESYTADDGPRTMHHFVNGGGGAYLSIGTALDWPTDPPVADWAFYPNTEAVRSKLDRETPGWKRPFWWWLTKGGGWPGSIEGLSGAFDFNHAPFFQSFMEIKVEGSARRVRLILYGVHGQLHWRDLQTGGAVIPPGQGPDDPVEFVVPM